MRKFLAGRHWTFWPLLTIIVLAGVFTFIFGQKGFLAYQNRYEEKKHLERQIALLKNKKRALQKKSNLLKRPEKVKVNILRKLGLTKEEINIIQFDSEDKVRAEIDYPYNLEKLQRIFYIVGSVLSVIVVFIAYRFRLVLDDDAEELL